MKENNYPERLEANSADSLFFEKEQVTSFNEYLNANAEKEHSVFEEQASNEEVRDPLF